MQEFAESKKQLLNEYLKSIRVEKVIVYNKVLLNSLDIQWDIDAIKSLYALFEDNKKKFPSPYEHKELQNFILGNYTEGKISYLSMYQMLVENRPSYIKEIISVKELQNFIEGNIIKINLLMKAENLGFNKTDEFRKKLNISRKKLLIDNYLEALDIKMNDSRDRYLPFYMDSLQKDYSLVIYNDALKKLPYFNNSEGIE